MLGLVSSVATTFTIMLFMSPCKEIIGARAMGTAVPRATTISSLCQVINCGLWLLYGTLKGDSTIMFVNSVGLLFGLYFVKSAYSILSSAKDADPVATRSLRNMIALAGTVLCALALYPFSPTQSMTTPMDLLGLFSSGLSVIMFGSPLSEMVTICRKGDASGMPLLQVATGAVCSGSWTLYGSLVGDVYVMTPNGMGFVLSVIQILVIGRYSNQLAMCGFSQAPMQGQLNSDTLV